MTETIRPTILVVDDQPIFREMGKVLCTFPGCEPTFLEAENGLQASEIIKKHRDDITLIITDVNMPVMDGMKMLKQEGIQKFIPVVVLTAYPDHREEAHELQVVLFLDKSSDAAHNAALLEPAIRSAHVMHHTAHGEDKKELSMQHLGQESDFAQFVHGHQGLQKVEDVEDIFHVLKKALDGFLDCHFRAAIRCSGKLTIELLGEERDPARDSSMEEKMMLRKNLSEQKFQSRGRRWVTAGSSRISILCREPDRLSVQDRSLVWAMVTLLMEQADKQLKLIDTQEGTEE